MDCNRLSNELHKIFTLRSQVLRLIKRPFKASNQPKHYKTPKQSATSRIKSLPHGVCQNSSKPMPTRSPRHVERLSFLLRRNPTVELAGILERRYSLSLSKIKNSNLLHLILPPSRFVSQLKVGDDTIPTFVILSFNYSHNAFHVPKILDFDTWHDLSHPFPSSLYSCNLCHIIFHFMASDTRCLEKRANSDCLEIRRNSTW